MQPRNRLAYNDVNAAKANFDSIYTEPDPREYFRVLFGVDYIIPDLAKGIFQNVIAALEQKHQRRIRVLDIGCSFGINAALVRFPLDINRLAQRYVDLQAAGLTTGELIPLDRHYFRSWPKLDVEIIGCDVSEPAINYAREVGLIDHGIVGNFEDGRVSGAARDLLKGIDLIISTGSVGYVTDRTFARMLDAIGQPAPWVCSFVLRMFPYTAISSLMDEAGLVTEKLQGVTFVQRRFHSETECRQVIAELETQGIDPRNKEADGLLHAELFLSRPADDLTQHPLEELVSVTSGASRQFGRRFRRGDDAVIRLVR
ncbi:MAG TPA: class I SAM-dependent methyltransferase [Hyphomicrobiaceae bacterium]|nr:class I SAM-dependent methyltransferase [Hyphomicrobiaceae bacterium]